MALRPVRLKSPSQLPLAVKALGVALNNEARKAMVRTARFGHTAVVRMMSKTSPKPEASYTYRNAWTVVKTKDGAILGNSAKHSYFEEVGRRAGSMPPFSNPSEGILHWVQLKRFKFAKDGKIQKRKAKKGTKKKSPAANRVANQRKKAASSSGPTPPKPKSAKKSKGKGKMLKAQKRFAFLVAKKISKKGTPGRYVLARTMPAIQKRAIRETKKAMKKVTQKGGKP